MTITHNGNEKEVNFCYIIESPKWEVEKPYRIHDLDPDVCGGLDTTNVELESHPAMVWDLRGRDKSLCLKEDGFCYSDFITSSTPGSSESANLEYCRAAIQLLHRNITAQRIICYDLRFRRHTGHEGSIGTNSDRKEPDKPVETVHTDHTRSQGWSRVAHHLSSAEKASYFNGEWRIKIFNVWKPLNTVVEDMPLAICDPETIQEDDLIPVDSVGPGFNAELYYVKFNKRQKWYWISGQTAEEALIFLSWDSHAPREQFKFCPHASFKDPSTPEGVPFRESVEVRLITFEKL